MIYTKLFLTAVFWGGTFIAGRVVAGTVPPFSASFMRFLVAAGVLFAAVRIIDGKMPRIKKSQILPVLLLGMTGVFLYNLFFFKGLKLIHAGRAAAIIANNPIIIGLLSAAIFKESLGPVQWVGTGISVTGAMIVISRGDPAALWAGSLGWGEIFMFCCVMSWAAYSLLGKSVLREISPLTAVTYSTLFGVLLLLPPALWEGLPKAAPAYGIAEWSGFLYLGLFGTVLGFVWYYEGIRRIGAARASLFINFVPVSGVLLAGLLLGEPVSPSLLGGTLMVCAGVYLTNSRRFDAEARKSSP